MCELRLVTLLGRGESAEAVARQLAVSRSTVKTHLRNIFSKTGTSRQADLVRLFLTSLPPVAV